MEDSGHGDGFCLSQCDAEWMNTFCLQSEPSSCRKDFFPTAFSQHFLYNDFCSDKISIKATINTRRIKAISHSSRPTVLPC